MSISGLAETWNTSNSGRRTYKSNQDQNTSDTTSAPVGQLVEHRAVTREVVSSTPAGPSLRVLKIPEEKVLPL